MKVKQDLPNVFAVAAIVVIVVVVVFHYFENV
jgi:hypothetical protein